MRLRIRPPIAFGCLPFLLLGCQPNNNTPLPEPVLEHVKGTVTVQGKPLPKAVITFLQADEKGTLSVSETDDEGRYELTYMNRIGTAAAKYKVVISFLEGKDGTIYGLGARSGLAKPYGMLSAKERLPADWSDFGRATHTTVVPVGGATLDFDIPEPLLPPAEPDPAPTPDAAKKPDAPKPVDSAKPKAEPAKK